MADGLVISEMHFGPLFSFVEMYLMQRVKLQPCKWARHTKTDIGMLCSWGRSRSVCENKDMYHVGMSENGVYPQL